MFDYKKIDNTIFPNKGYQYGDTITFGRGYCRMLFQKGASEISGLRSCRNADHWMVSPWRVYVSRRHPMSKLCRTVTFLHDEFCKEFGTVFGVIDIYNEDLSSTCDEDSAEDDFDWRLPDDVTMQKDYMIRTEDGGFQITDAVRFADDMKSFWNRMCVEFRKLHYSFVEFDRLKMFLISSDQEIYRRALTRDETRKIEEEKKEREAEDSRKKMLGFINSGSVLITMDNIEEFQFEFDCEFFGNPRYYNVKGFSSFMFCKENQKEIGTYRADDGTVYSVDVHFSFPEYNGSNYGLVWYYAIAISDSRYNEIIIDKKLVSSDVLSVIEKKALDALKEYHSSSYRRYVVNSSAYGSNIKYSVDRYDFFAACNKSVGKTEFIYPDVNNCNLNMFGTLQPNGIEYNIRGLYLF